MTMRAITLEMTIPRGSPMITAAAAIATARRRRRRRSGRFRAPSARMTAASRVRSVIKVFVVEPRSTSATSPATMPRNPMSVLTCSIAASMGWVPSGTVMRQGGQRHALGRETFAQRIRGGAQAVGRRVRCSDGDAVVPGDAGEVGCRVERRECGRLPRPVARATHADDDEVRPATVGRGDGKGVTDRGHAVGDEDFAGSSRETTEWWP